MKISIASYKYLILCLFYQGDSGGPLVDYDESGTATQIGIVDFVDADGCGAGEPSGYTRTEAYLDWITENTGVKFN